MHPIKILKLSVCCGLLLTACHRSGFEGAVSAAPVNASFKAPKPVPAAQLIVPGKSIGQTSLKEDAELVYKRLGKPDSGDAAMGKSLSTWYAKHDPAGYQTQIFCSRYMNSADDNVSRVKQIRVTSPYFKTAEGLGAGSTLREIRRVFTVRKASTYKINKQPFFIYDTDKGIAFEISAQGKCVGVIVYLPGDNAGKTYLPFHSK